MCPETPSSSGGDATRQPLVASNAAFGAILTVVVLVVLYSLLVVQQPLLGALVATWVIGIYVVWRFVRWFTDAYERRTAAIERVADSLDDADR
jgi:xanthosine utilization system XapX-like protein